MFGGMLLTFNDQQAFQGASGGVAERRDVVGSLVVDGGVDEMDKNYIATEGEDAYLACGNTVSEGLSQKSE